MAVVCGLAALVNFQVRQEDTMTRRKAEVLTGYEIRRIPMAKEAFRFGAFDRDQLIAEAEHRNERIALTWLVNAIYKMHLAVRQLTPEEACHDFFPFPCKIQAKYR